MVETAVIDKPAIAPSVTVSQAEGGSYGHASTAFHAVESHKTKTPFLSEIGSTTTDPIMQKRISSPKFETHWQSAKWSETYGGRLAIRSVSRGVVGAAFYAGAQMFAGKQMASYGENIAGDGPANILQHIASMIDNTAGKAIYSAVKLVTNDENKAYRSVNFRNTKDFGYSDEGGNRVKGRSLGDELVSVTFDFAAMSFGDFMGRYAVGLFDPKARTKWIDEQGNLDIPNGLKELSGKIFRGITYAAGEDIAVALPYVYYMKWQRNALDKIVPGSKEDGDRALFGGSYKVNDKGQVTDDFQMTGIVDVVGRFTMYNVMTKMYRDLYNKVEDFLEKWKAKDYNLNVFSPEKLPDTPQEAVKSLFEKVKDSVKYVAVTSIKTVFYMVPSSLLFAVLTVPRTRTRGVAINPENIDENGRPDKIMTKLDGKETSATPGMPVDNPYYWRKSGKAVDYPFAHEDNHKGVFTGDYYKKNGNQPPWYEGIGNAIGNFSYKIGSPIDNFLNEQGWQDRGDKEKQFGEIFSRAAVAYTPYFMLKTDVAAAFLDTARSNIAIERCLGGTLGMIPALASFNGKTIGEGWKEFCKGIVEVSLAVTKQPFHDLEREKLAQEQMRKGWRGSNEAYQEGKQEVYVDERAFESATPKVVKAADLRPTFVKLDTSPDAEKSFANEVKRRQDAKESQDKPTNTIAKFKNKSFMERAARQNENAVAAGV